MTTNEMLQILIKGQDTLKQELNVLKEGQDTLKQELNVLKEGQDSLKNGYDLLNQGQNALKEQLAILREEMRHGFRKTHARLDKQGKQFAYLEDDAPTREEHDGLTKRVEKIEKVLSS